MANNSRTARGYLQTQRELAELHVRFSQAAKANNVKKMEEFLAIKKPFPDGRDRSLNINDLGMNDGQMPLHHAAAGDAHDAARFLFDKGADVNGLNQTRQTPLHMAGLSTKSAETAKLLLEKGADLSAIDAAGRTPLHLAARTGNLKIVEAMVAAGADLHVRDNEGLEPLHMAALRGRTECLAFLFEKGGYSDAARIESRAQAMGMAVWGRQDKAKAYLQEQEDIIDERRDDVQRKAEHKRRLSIIDDILSRNKNRKGPGAP